MYSCGDKEKFCTPLSLVSIYYFIGSIYSTGEKVRCWLIEDMKPLMKHEDMVVFWNVHYNMT